MVVVLLWPMLPIQACGFHGLHLDYYANTRQIRQDLGHRNFQFRSWSFRFDHRTTGFQQSRRVCQPYSMNKKSTIQNCYEREGYEVVVYVYIDQGRSGRRRGCQDFWNDALL